MYNIGELIVYGNTGVCRVKDIAVPDMGEKGRLYYQLEPVYSGGVIYIPVDTKVFMRPVITREQAQRLISDIPAVKAQAHYSSSVQGLMDYYQSAIKSHDCADLIELVMSIYAKSQNMQEQKRKIGQIDSRFMKKAEELLHGELAIALDISIDQVAEYIKDMVSDKL